jgi:hypothetical protein
MKDTITLQGRTYECTKLVQQRFGLDDQTLRKWAKNNIVPTPVRLANKNFYDWEAIESKILKYWRLVRTNLKKQTPRWRGAGRKVQQFRSLMATPSRKLPQ